MEERTTPALFASSTSVAPINWATFIQDRSQAQRKSNPPPANTSQENNRGGLLFITGNKPDDFKSKKNMTKARKKAMGSYLEHTKDKKLRDSHEQERSLKGTEIEALKETETEGSGVIAPLLRGCLDLFLSLLRRNTRSISKRDGRILRRSYETLTLWAEDHGAWDGKLDSVLEQSKGLQGTTLLTLNSLCGVLINGLSKVICARAEDDRLAILRSSNAQTVFDQTKWILDGLEDATDDSSSSDSELSEEEKTEKNQVRRVVEEVRAYTNCLVDLNAALQCPAMDPKYDDEPRILNFTARAAYEYFAELVTNKYPRASTEVVECLGKANWYRYLRMQSEREINANARVLAREKQDHTGSEFQDSGLGTSIPPNQSDYAESIASFISSISGGKRIPIPPLSTEAKAGEPFECTACGQLIRITTDRMWRKHLFLDLQPYTCLRPDCDFSATPFANFNDWSNHLELDHKLGPDWQTTQCELCLQQSGNGKAEILKHFARHMEDIALAALPQDIDPDARSEGDSSTTLDTKDGPGTESSHGKFESLSDMNVHTSVLQHPEQDKSDYQTISLQSNSEEFNDDGYEEAKTAEPDKFEENIESPEERVRPLTPIRNAKMKPAVEGITTGKDTQNPKEKSHSPSPPDLQQSTAAGVSLAALLENNASERGPLEEWLSSPTRDIHDRLSQFLNSTGVPAPFTRSYTRSIHSSSSMAPACIHQPNTSTHPPSLYNYSDATPIETPISTGLANQFSVIPLLEDVDGVLERKELPNQSRPPIYECPFWFLSCSYVSYDKDEWETHGLSHFRGEEPPRVVQCPLCEWKMACEDGLIAWNHRMVHISSSHTMRGETLRTSRPDFHLFQHLWRKRLIDDQDLKELKGGNHNLTRPPISSFPTYSRRDRDARRQRQQHIPARRT